MYRKDRHNPCYKCPVRMIGCHGVCKAHQTWLGIHQEEIEARRKDIARDEYGSWPKKEKLR